MRIYVLNDELTESVSGTLDASSTYSNCGNYCYILYVTLCEDTSKVPSVKILVIGFNAFTSHNLMNTSHKKCNKHVKTLPENFKALMHYECELHNQLQQNDVLTYLTIIGNICRFFGLTFYSSVNENFIHYKLTEKVFAADIEANTDLSLMSTLYILLTYCMHKDSNVVHNAMIFYNSTISDFTSKSNGLRLFYSNIERKVKYSVNLKKMIKIVQFIN